MSWPCHTQYGNVLQVHGEVWTGDDLSLRVKVLATDDFGHSWSVRDDNVRVEVVLPWLLARPSNGIQAAIRKSGGQVSVLLPSCCPPSKLLLTIERMRSVRPAAGLNWQRRIRTVRQRKIFKRHKAQTRPCWWCREQLS